jgi:cysteine desulfurase/selenocysteine lyase
VSGPLIYFDHAASAGSRPGAVGEAMLRALREAPGNPGRSQHRISLRAARVVEEARLELAALLRIPEPSHLVFTKSATEAINLVLHGFLRPDDRVLASGWEHNAVLRPLRGLERARGIGVELIPAASGWGIDLDWLEGRLRAGGIRLVAVLAASNVTGEILPVREIGALCRRFGAFFLVDAAQAAGICDFDLAQDPIDALALAGHKSLYGPSGTGALWLRNPELVQPLVLGGTGSRSESEEQPEFPPDRFEAGTQNVPGLAGLAAGVRYVREWRRGPWSGPRAILERHRELARALVSRLREIPGIHVHAPPDPERHLAVASFTADGLDTALLARELDRRDILGRPGLHCASRAHRTLGTFPAGTLRFSLSVENDEGEIDRACAALREIVERLHTSA